MTRAFSFIELLTVICIVGLLTVIAVPNFMEAETRADIASVTENQKRTAMALSMYHIDHGLYPSYYPFTAAAGYVAPARVTKNYNQLAVEAQGGSWPTEYFYIPSFAVVDTAGHAVGLTTPVAYLDSYLRDEFSYWEATTFNFAQGPRDYLIWSWGPDGFDQLDGGEYSAGHNAAEYIVRWNQPLPSPYLIAGPITRNTPPGAPTSGTGAFTYNPTNGTASAGDIWRTRRSGSM